MIDKIKQDFLTVIYNEMIEPDIWVLTFEKPDINFQPGQFIMLDTIPQHVRKNRVVFGYDIISLLFRPFSIYTVSDTKFSVLYKVKPNGVGTNQLSWLRAGDKIVFKGPLGTPINIQSIPDRTGTIHLIGGGVGISPIIFLAQTLIKSGYKVKVYFGFQHTGNFLDFILESLVFVGVIDGEDIYLSYEHLNLMRPIDPFPSDFVTYKGISCMKGGMIQAFNNMWLPIIHNNPGPIFICAPNPVMLHTHLVMSSVNNQRNVFVYMEERMACGVGVCRGCNIGGKLVCKDGPVFNAKDIYGLL